MRCRFLRNLNWVDSAIPILLLSYVLFALLYPRQFALSDFESLSIKDIESELQPLQDHPHNNQTIVRPKCPLLPTEENYVLDKIVHNSSTVNFDSAQLVFHTELGGRWSPKSCSPQHYVAIIVPYKNREDQLRKFLTYMHPYLQLQLIQYQIFIVEQLDDDISYPFNRGKLINIGFEASKKYGGFQCFIIHDIDLLPENIQNIYGCTHRPRHMSAVVSSFRYTLQYEKLFGGVFSITSKQFQLVNGFSNEYYGWGGEDDNFGQRLQIQNIPIIRFPPHLCSYSMMPHVKQTPNDDRFKKLLSTVNTFPVDGLNSLKYSVVNFVTLPLYTLIQVKLTSNS